MKIQDYTPSVAPVTPVVQAPQFARPVAEGFTAGAKATQGFGDTLAKIGGMLEQHVLDRNRTRDAAQVADLDTNFRMNLQNKLLSTDTEKIKVDGKDVERPVGLLSRPLASASGSTQEFDQYYADIKKNYLAQARTPEMAAMISERLDNQYATTREMVIKHEAKQGRLAVTKSLATNLEQMNHDAAAISEPAMLKPAIENALQVQDAISSHSEYDDATAASMRKNAAGDIVSKSVLSTLMSTGDLEKAQALLDVGKDYINADRYEKLSEQLATGADRLQKQAQFIQTRKQIEGEADILTGMATGKLSWMNIDDIGKQVRDGQVSDTFATAVADVLRRKGKYSPQEDKNINYPKVVSAIYQAQTQEELHKTLTEVMQDHKNMSQDKLAIFIAGAMQRAQSLPYSTKFQDYDGNQAPKVEPRQKEIDGAALSIVSFGRKNGLTHNEIGSLYGQYTQGLQANMPPKAAYDAAVKNWALSKHPEIASTGVMPTIILDGQSPKFLQQTAEAGSSPWLYDSKTRSIIANPKFKAQREEKK